MKTTTRSTSQFATTLVLGGVLTVMLAGCSSHKQDEATQHSAPPSLSITATPRPIGPGGSPAASQPVPAAINRTNPSAVAEAALVALDSYDTQIDNGPNGAARRAVPWLSQTFAGAVMRDRPVSGAGAEWTEWASHRAYVTPTLSAGEDQSPPDSATTALRQYEVTLTPIGRDGWIGQPVTESVFVTLKKSPQDERQWAVDEVQVG